MKDLQVRVYTDITEEPVSVAEAKLFCRVTGTEEDEIFLLLIQSARQLLEKYTQCSFAEKKIHCTWVESREDDTYELPYGPIISVDAVYRIDEEATEEAMTLNSDYYVYGDQDAKLKISRYWSSGVISTTSVRVEYTAGYGGSGVEALPNPLKLAILKQVATDYELRENIGSTGLGALSNESKKLAAPYRKKIWF